MSTFANNIECLEPGIINNCTGFEAWFTLKNASQLNRNEEIPGLNLGFNTKSGRNQVLANRDLLFTTLDIDPDWVALADQVHGTRVVQVTTGGVYPEIDGLITAVPGLALGIQVADCAAVLLADPVAQIAGAVHAGWRGAAGNILGNALEMFEDAGSDPSELAAWISPCICRDHFEVGEEVAEQFPDEFVDRVHFDKPHVNLKAYLFHQLRSGGVLEKNIEASTGCTIGDADSYYSHRRENGRTGRMMGIIRISG
ncbi:MAG: peptidoglycan editing factor PgeF [Balneolaceae bacterium]|nr:peptidoglycan editing factor PgeF [Balneolaceae bacterium]